MTTSAIPVIDLTPLRGGGEDGLASVAEEIGAACRGIGFFAVTGHGVPADLRADVFAIAEDFFARSDDEKRTVLYSARTGNRGYVPMRGEALDPTKPADLKEAFNIGLDLAPDDPAILAGEKFRAVNLWPDVPRFRETMLAYFDAVWSLGRTLHRAFAVDLGLPPDAFEDKLNRPLATLRVLHYPARPAEVAEGQMGAGIHTDYGNVTLLATDDAGGLEVQGRDGEWLAAPYLADGLICNIGDCLMRWTNDVYVSTPHRVVNPKGRERTSVAFFLDPNPDAVVECLPTCTNESRPPRYPPIRGDDYLQSRLAPTYAAAGTA